MTDNIVKFPEMDTAIYPLEDIIEGMYEDGVKELVAFTRNSDGTIQVYATHSAQEADDLIDLGVERWEELLVYAEEDEEDGE